MWIKEIYTAILDTLFPPRCPLCKSYINQQGLFCDACYRKTVNVRRIPLDKGAIKHLSYVYSLTNYHDGMKKIIYSLKYQKKFIYLPHIHRILQQHMIVKDLDKIDYVVPVPLHKEKLKERGFNQTEKIFFVWAKENGFVWTDILIRKKETVPQYQLTLKERKQNIMHAFQVGKHIDLKGKMILLLDDIYTTGVTMDACAKVLKEAGAKSVLGLALSSDA